MLENPLPKKSQTHVARKVTAFVAFIVLSGFAVADARELKPDTNASTGQYSDEEVFRGLILGGGPVATVIPEIRDFRRAENLTADTIVLRQVAAVHERLISAIYATEPTLIPRFAAEVRSGDRLRIGRAFREASASLTKALASIPEVEKLSAELASSPEKRSALRARLQSAAPNDVLADSSRTNLSLASIRAQRARESTDGTCALGVVVVAVIAAALVADAVLIVQAVAAANTVWMFSSVFVFGFEPDAESGGSLISSERMIDSIARTFATS